MPTPEQMAELSPNMLRTLATSVEIPGGVTSNGATIDALIRRGLAEDAGRIYGQRTLRPTEAGRTLIAQLGGPREAVRHADQRTNA